MPRVILIDDEPPARRGLKRMLAVFDDIEVIGEAGTIDQARDLIVTLRPDAVFLDIELSSGKGFEIVTDLSPETAVIVVTAYSLYATDAFDVALQTLVSRHPEVTPALPVNTLFAHELRVQDRGPASSDYQTLIVGE